MTHVNDITQELHKESEAVPEEDRAPLLSAVRLLREGLITQPWSHQAVRDAIRDPVASHSSDHAEVKAKWQAKRAAQMD